MGRDAARLPHDAPAPPQGFLDKDDDLVRALAHGHRDAARLTAGLDEALACARGNGALAYELRILMSLARLSADGAARALGLEALREAYGRFEEGFDTPDLREAGRVLES